MIDDRAIRLAREALAKQRLKMLTGVEAADLLLADNVANFLRAQVSAPLQKREHLGALFIDAAIRPIAYSMPYRGYLGRVHIEVHKVLAPAVMFSAAGLIVFHNRPRGRRSPIKRDASIARQVRFGCEFMGLRLLDYLVLGAGGSWASLRDRRRVRFHSLGDDLPLPGEDGRARVLPKYRNPEAPHQTWSGRGRKAKWLDDKLNAGDGAKLEDFAIED